jgi:deoxyribonuclease (pyrimidine dimer)
MTRINVVPVQELQREHLVAEYKEIVRVFALARSAQYELHKKKIPNEYTLGTGHVLYFYDKLKYITERYNSLCTEMKHRGYVCNRVEQSELERGIDRSLFWDYSVTDAALALNRARISERLADSAAKKQLKGK